MNPDIGYQVFGCSLHIYMLAVQNNEQVQDLDHKHAATIQIVHYSDYSNHLNTGLVWNLNSRFVSYCQMVQYLNGGLKTSMKKPVYVP